MGERPDKSIRVQNIVWEEADGAWFSEIGVIEKDGCDWFYTLYEDTGETAKGPYLNPHAAAKQAAIETYENFSLYSDEPRIDKKIRLERKIRALRSALAKATALLNGMQRGRLG